MSGSPVTVSLTRTTGVSGGAVVGGGVVVGPNGMAKRGRNTWYTRIMSLHTSKILSILMQCKSTKIERVAFSLVMLHF